MKSCLFRYIAKSIRMTEFHGHTAEWESRCIYEIFKGLGYQIDVLNWKGTPSITRTYDVVFDVGNLTELTAAFGPDTIKILHLTGADNVWRNQQGLRRTAELNERRGANLPYVRYIPEPEAVYENIELADFVTLLGNDFTLSTYPERYRDKIHLLNVSAAV